MTTATEKKAWTPARVRELRERLGLSRLEAAEKVGVTARTWLSWELPSQDRAPSPRCELLLSLLEKGKI